MGERALFGFVYTCYFKKEVIVSDRVFTTYLANHYVFFL